MRTHILTVTDLNTQLKPDDYTFRNKLNREILTVESITNQMKFTGIYTKFHQNTKKYSLYSAPHVQFSKIDHRKSKTQLTTEFEIVYRILNDNHLLKLDYNCNNRSMSNSWKLNITINNDIRVGNGKKINGIKDFRKSMKMKVYHSSISEKPWKQYLEENSQQYVSEYEN